MAFDVGFGDDAVGVAAAVAVDPVDRRWQTVHRFQRNRFGQIGLAPVAIARGPQVRKVLL